MKLNLSSALWAAAALSIGLAGCGDAEKDNKKNVGENPGWNVPGTQLYIDAPDGLYHGPLTTIEIKPSKDGPVELEVSLSETLTAMGTFQDGTAIEITKNVVNDGNVTSAAAEVIALGDRTDESVTITAKSPGDSKIQFSLGDITGELAVKVIPAALIEFKVEIPSTEIPRGGNGRITAKGIYRDGEEKDLSEMTTWTTSDETVATVMNGLVTGLKNGMVKISAKFEDQEQSLDLTVLCKYPDAGSRIHTGNVMPNLSWGESWDPAAGAFAEFKIEDLYCNEQFEDKDTFFFVLNAGWCGPCHAWMKAIAREITNIEAEGGQIIYVTGETRRRGEGATSRDARDLVAMQIQDSPGIRVGDEDTMPSGSNFRRSGVIEAWPTTVVVRKKDMKVISSWAGAFRAGAGPLVDIAKNPQWDWSDVSNPVPVMEFENKCTSPDEASEPNDNAATAGAIDAGTMQAGICTDAPDFFKVDVAGNWRITIQFTNSEANLDMHAWDTTGDKPLVVGGSVIGSATNRGYETFEHSGPAVVRIAPRIAGSSTSYRLVLEQL